MKTEETKMVNYLNKTSKHLFRRSGHIAFRPNSFKHQEYLFKVFTTPINGIEHRIEVQFNDEVTNVIINKIQAYDKNSYNIMKTNLFPDGKSVSIKTFKKVREIMNSLPKSYESIDEAKSTIKGIFENGK